jgi:aldehyde:ferredoxin oxidoreductase
MEVCNAAGLCMFGYLSYPWQAIPDQLSAATGQQYDMERIVETGVRIFTLRHAFNLREGINPMTRNMPGRIIGEPPLKEGNVKDITVDYKTMAVEFLQELGWDINTTVPSQQSLRKLGLDFLIEDMKKVSVKSI